MTNTPVPTIAAFDLDGTLSNGGSVFKWLRFLRGDRATYIASASLALPLLVGAIRSGRWADRAKERLFHKLLAGLDLTEVRDRSRIFAVEHFERHGRQSMLSRLRWHLQQGHSVVLVSASPQIYVDMVAEMLETAGGLGTRLAVDARGRLTGSYLGQNCRGKEKMRRLAEWIEETHPHVTPIVYAYGNSRGDRRMLGAATFPFNVGRLGRLGALRRFPRARHGHFPEEPTSPNSPTPDE
ncbi:MAG TPA: HAD-IB family hydrolase [Acidimicrobiales bacterium]|nr:HAD-IB family hydrolase [Acidimicrobiales bacterium]